MVDAAQVAADDAATGRDVLRGLRVLVVDDDQDTCEIVGAVLRRAGAEVRTCMSASQALTVLDSWVPDLLVSDIAMPGEDGYTLIRKVRARKSEEGGRMVAVALTAYGRERGPHAGALGGVPGARREADRAEPASAPRRARDRTRHGRPPLTSSSDEARPMRCRWTVRPPSCASYARRGSPRSGRAAPREPGAWS